MTLRLRIHNWIRYYLRNLFVWRLGGLFLRWLWTFWFRLVIHFCIPILTRPQTRVESRFYPSLERIVHLTFWKYRWKLFSFLVWCVCVYFFSLTGLTFPGPLFRGEVWNLWVHLFGDIGLGLAKRVDFFPFDCIWWKSFHYVPGVGLLGQHNCFDLYLFVTLSLKDLGTSLSALSPCCIHWWTSYSESFRNRSVHRLHLGIFFNYSISWTWPLCCLLPLKLAASRFQSGWIVHLWCKVDFQGPANSLHCSLYLFF